MKFERVFAREDAFFSVTGSKDAPNNSTLAETFFPNDPPELCLVKIYPLAFA